MLSASTLAELELIGPPVVAVQGNQDDAELCRQLPVERTVEAERRPHRDGARRRPRGRAACSGCGAASPTPTPSCSATRTCRCTSSDDGFQIFNPGSPTDRRRAPAHTMGLARVNDGRVDFELVRGGLTAWTSTSCSWAPPASAPTANRGLPATLVRRGGERLLFDCGEGTQRQIMRSVGQRWRWTTSSSPTVHADHVLGLPGLLKTYGLHDRERRLRLWGPPGLRKLWDTLGAVVGRLSFDVQLRRWTAGRGAARRRLHDHRVQRGPPACALGYALVEHERPGRFDEARARELGVQPGPGLRPPPGRRDRGRRDPGPGGGPARPGRTSCWPATAPRAR